MLSPRYCSVILFSAALLSASAQEAGTEKALDIYGHVMTDMGFNAGASDASWFDVMRPTKLPGFKDEYGPEGNIYFSVRQSRFGVKGYTNTPLGELFTQFEWELFGVGVDAGQTTFRLRHAYGQLGKFGVGQYWSPFMDIDIFPNSLEYWGPSGMVLYRNIQLRYMPIQGDDKLTIALERPGASADGGSYADYIALEDVRFRFPTPDLSAEYRKKTGFGYVELAGIVRTVDWEDLTPDSLDLSGGTTGWGLNLTSTIKVAKRSTLRFGGVYGAGIQNYMNDATTDIGVKENPGNANKPIEGYALPMYGLSLFLDHGWNDKVSTAIGYSRMDFDLAETSDSSTFKAGQYALVNVLFAPAANILWGVELQYGSRDNFKDSWSYDAIKVQASFKYNFGTSLYRKKSA